MSENQIFQIKKYIEQLVLPRSDSHKGENGKVLVIGGSELFHAASFWAAVTASKIVDMVHFSSPTLVNNKLMSKRAKEKFWEGIVVPWEEVEHYIQEDDAILIGPGMERGEATRAIVNNWLTRYPEKRWVVDGGALQEVEPSLLNEQHIITPNKREMKILLDRLRIKYNVSSIMQDTKYIIQNTKALASELRCTVLAKGEVDVVSSWQIVDGSWISEEIEIHGGSPGMTKGGTGDVLAGVVVGLYAKSPAISACVTASYVNKQAGERLSERVGVYYSAIDLIPEVQVVLGEITKT